MSPSELVRSLLTTLFPQKENFEESNIPININYSVPYGKIDKNRILIYDASTTLPENVLGNNTIFRRQGLTIVCSDKQSQLAYNRLDNIMRYLRKSKSTEFIRIRPLSDIEPVGFNTKGYYLYQCDFSLERVSN